MKSLVPCTIALSLLLGACADNVTLGPGDALVGSWISSDAHFVATHASVKWTSRCQSADFAPIVLDSLGGFSVESTAFVITGNIQHSPGEALHLNGRILNGNMVLTMYTVHNAFGVSDPVSVTLSPGASNDPLVCNA